MSDKSNIDELLNGFVDGEISERQATEVKRLMLHDPAIAARVARMQKQRQLLAALPAESAPADMASSVRAVLERRTLLDAASGGRHQVLGSVHLMGRKFAAVAAMLVLLGGLGYLVYRVIGPESSRKQVEIVTIARKTAPDRTAVVSEKPAPVATTLELNLTTDSTGGLSRPIARADSIRSSARPLSHAGCGIRQRSIGNPR
jgi:anti-sigma factor RsiW